MILAERPVLRIRGLVKYYRHGFLGRRAGLPAIDDVDLRVVHRIADEVIVLKDGQVVDRFAGSTIGDARHPVTTRLLKATVRIGGGPL